MKGVCVCACIHVCMRAVRDRAPLDYLDDCFKDGWWEIVGWCLAVHALCVCMHKYNVCVYTMPMCYCYWYSGRAHTGMSQSQITDKGTTCVVLVTLLQNAVWTSRPAAETWLPGYTPCHHHSTLAEIIHQVNGFFTALLASVLTAGNGSLWDLGLAWGGRIAHLAEWQTEKPGAIMTLVWFLAVAKGLFSSPAVSFQRRLSLSLFLTVLAQQPHSVACINSCAHGKHPEHGSHTIPCHTIVWTQENTAHPGRNECCCSCG